jgi:hypothetical protein
MSHKLVELLTNVKVYFLPPNTTSGIQPMEIKLITIEEIKINLSKFKTGFEPIYTYSH